MPRPNRGFDPSGDELGVRLPRGSGRMIGLVLLANLLLFCGAVAVIAIAAKWVLS